MGTVINLKFTVSAKEDGRKSYETSGYESDD